MISGGQAPPPPPPAPSPPPPPPPPPRENQPEIPQDGYEWKKYGQKPIKSTGQNRTYFKCKNKRCRMMKRVEWLPSRPDQLRVMYVGGEHNHPSPQPQSDLDREASTSEANRYNLATQIFGGFNNSS